MTGSAAKRVSVISFATSDIVWSATYSGKVFTAKFSKNGKWLAVGLEGSDDINIYNVPSFTLNMTFNAEHTGGGTVN